MQDTSIEISPDPTAVASELERITGSPSFRKAERCLRLLRYLTGRALEGRGGELKEYTLGVSVFERPKGAYVPHFRARHAPRPESPLDAGVKPPFLPWFAAHLPIYTGFVLQLMQPELEARKRVDALLDKSGWIVQDRQNANPKAGVGVAVREFLFGSGEADYALFVDGKAIDVIEAKKVGSTLSSVAFQTQKYLMSLPETFSSWRNPPPFGYKSTGEETFFTDLPRPGRTLQARFRLSPARNAP